MIHDIKKLPIIKVSERGKSPQEDIVVTELPLTIILNRRKQATIPCSFPNLDYLAVGFLLAKGLVTSRKAVKTVTVDELQGIVWVRAEAAKPVPQRKVRSGFKISAAEVFTLIDKFVKRSRLFRATGGVHNAALCDRKNIMVFAEDISRHNTIDKILGQCLLDNIATAECLLITSGRVTSEIVLRVAKRNIPMLISEAAPTDLGVKMAEDLGITLIGFARDKRMNIYTHARRLEDG